MDRGSCHAGLPDPTEYSRHETKLRTRVLLWISIFFLMSLPLATLSTSGMTLTLQAVEVERLAGESQSSSVQSAGTCRLGSRIWGNSENERVMDLWRTGGLRNQSRKFGLCPLITKTPACYVHWEAVPGAFGHFLDSGETCFPLFCFV